MIPIQPHSRKRKSNPNNNKEIIGKKNQKNKCAVIKVQVSESSTGQTSDNTSCNSSNSSNSNSSNSNSSSNSSSSGNTSSQTVLNKNINLLHSSNSSNSSSSDTPNDNNNNNNDNNNPLTELVSQQQSDKEKLLTEDEKIEKRKKAACRYSDKYRQRKKEEKKCREKTNEILIEENKLLRNETFSLQKKLIDDTLLLQANHDFLKQRVQILDSEVRSLSDERQSLQKYVKRLEMAVLALVTSNSFPNNNHNHNHSHSHSHSHNHSHSNSHSNNINSSSPTSTSSNPFHPSHISLTPSSHPPTSPSSSFDGSLDSPLVSSTLTAAAGMRVRAPYPSLMVVMISTLMTLSSLFPPCLFHSTSIASSVTTPSVCLSNLCF